MPRALVSVSDKTGIADLGRGLAARGFELVSTGGTARALSDAGLAVTNVSDLTGFPEMMDGRVKTLHPVLHGGILARRDRPDDLDAVERHGLRLVDIVVVNLYPFVKAAANPATPFDALVEEIDIGGPSLVRAAAKIRRITRACSRHSTRRRASGSGSSSREKPSRTRRLTIPRSPRRWRPCGSRASSSCAERFGDSPLPQAEVRRRLPRAPASHCRVVSRSPSTNFETCVTEKIRINALRGMRPQL